MNKREKLELLLNELADAEGLQEWLAQYIPELHNKIKALRPAKKLLQELGVSELLEQSTYNK